MNQMGKTTTNPLGKDSTILPAYVLKTVAAKLRGLADESGIKQGEYLRLVLTEVARREVLVEQKVVLLGKLEPVNSSVSSKTDVGGFVQDALDKTPEPPKPPVKPPPARGGNKGQTPSTKGRQP